MSHSVIAAFSARVLRPGSNSSTDDLLRRLITEWESYESALGVEIDARTIVYVLRRDEGLDKYLGHFPVT